MIRSDDRYLGTIRLKTGYHSTNKEGGTTVFAGVLPDKFSYTPTPYCGVDPVFQYGQNEKKDNVAKDYIKAKT